jgi:hypothetical protein
LRQIAKYRGVDIVHGKAIRVLGNAERFEPLRNLLHRGPYAASSSNVSTRSDQLHQTVSVDQIGHFACGWEENIPLTSVGKVV